MKQFNLTINQPIMNTKLKVGDRVNVISGANLYPELYHNKEGELLEIDGNHILVLFDNGGRVWCYDNKIGGKLKYEILPNPQSIIILPEQVIPSPKWLPIDRDNLPSDKVIAIDYPTFKDVYYGTLELTEDNRTMLYIGGGSYLYRLTHYIPLSDLLNLPIAE